MDNLERFIVDLDINDSDSVTAIREYLLSNNLGDSKYYRLLICRLEIKPSLETCKELINQQFYRDYYISHYLHDEIDNIGYFDKLHGKFISDPLLYNHYGKPVQRTGSCFIIKQLYKARTDLPIPYKMLSIMPAKDQRIPNPRLIKAGGKVINAGFTSHTHEYDYSWKPDDLEVSIYGQIPIADRVIRPQRIKDIPTVKKTKSKISWGTKITPNGTDGSFIRFKLDIPLYKGVYYLNGTDGLLWLHDDHHTPVLLIGRIITRLPDRREKDDISSLYPDTDWTAFVVYDLIHSTSVSVQLLDEVVPVFNRIYNPSLCDQHITERKQYIRSVSIGSVPIKEVDRDDPTNQILPKRSKPKAIDNTISKRDLDYITKSLRYAKNPVLDRLFAGGKYRLLLKVLRECKKDRRTITQEDIHKMR